ncbi:hypothetical protein BaRGS_00024238 [Batillaria attramentaria]|uniref:Uncharacterized protein n=1 Tax=Batillaria attramentaria TaxID=370345 RepID=A0ABD0KBP9_9CAEN
MKGHARDAGKETGVSFHGTYRFPPYIPLNVPDAATESRGHRSKRSFRRTRDLPSDTVKDLGRGLKGESSVFPWNYIRHSGQPDKAAIDPGLSGWGCFFQSQFSFFDFIAPSRASSTPASALLQPG